MIEVQKTEKFQINRGHIVYQVPSVLTPNNLRVDFDQLLEIVSENMVNVVIFDFSNVVTAITYGISMLKKLVKSLLLMGPQCSIISVASHFAGPFSDFMRDTPEIKYYRNLFDAIDLDTIKSFKINNQEHLQELIKNLDYTAKNDLLVKAILEKEKSQLNISTSKSIVDQTILEELFKYNKKTDLSLNIVSNKLESSLSSSLATTIQDKRVGIKEDQKEETQIGSINDNVTIDLEKGLHLHFENSSSTVSEQLQNELDTHLVSKQENLSKNKDSIAKKNNSEDEV